MPARSRTREPGATTKRGYGYTHQQKRKQLLPAAIGTRCSAKASPKCTIIMTNPALMHLDHSRPIALGGTEGDRIICKPCNLTLGTRLGNLLRYHPPQRRLPRW